MIKQTILALVAVAVGMGVVACGERPQVVEYKQGVYQGKPDKPPYDAAPFGGNKTEWERAVKTRNQSQNEYKRIS